MAYAIVRWNTGWKWDSCYYKHSEIVLILFNLFKVPFFMFFSFLNTLLVSSKSRLSPNWQISTDEVFGTHFSINSFKMPVFWIRKKACQLWYYKIYYIKKLKLRLVISLAILYLVTTKSSAIVVPTVFCSSLSEPELLESSGILFCYY